MLPKVKPYKRLLAIDAEGWNNKHINIYLEGINRAQGEINGTEHHLFIVFKKKYLNEEKFNYFTTEYNNCGKMLSSLKHSLESFKSNSQKPITYDQRHDRKSNPHYQS